MAEDAPIQPDPYAGPCGKNALVCGECSADCAEKRAELRRALGAKAEVVQAQLEGTLRKLGAA